jgi:serine/threonine protein kinase
MALQPSTRLGPYEIISSIGAGGMGEVYRARDTRLDRIVAVKVLPEHLSSNLQLRERFEREARAISSLSHPHICALYDVGQQNGIDYLVMEYLEGETLAGRLKKGPLPTDQVLQYAVQITDALDTAHKHAVVHRDLKPGNIMLTRTGAKLLDFGLAKVRAAEAVAGMTARPTQTTPLTGEGTILGTLQYMAPEQLEGADADARTDIFALGAVIYEMATGRKAFTGKSQASLISAIMGVEPPPLSTLQPMSPPALDHVVRICLAKEPDARWQTAHDVLLQLKWIASAGSQAGSLAPVVSRSKRRQWLSRVFTGVVSLIALAVSAVHFGKKPAELQSVRFQVPPPDKASIDMFNIPVVSPDGRHVVYGGEDLGGSRLWIHSLDSLVTRLLPETEEAFAPFWSPDSRYVGYSTRDKLKKIDISGGVPETLCDVGGYLGGAWNQEGIILFVPQEGNLHRVSAAGGEVKSVLDLDKSRKETGHAWPHFLPDGRHFLYLSNTADAGKSGIFVASLDSKETRRLISAESNVSYAPPGFLIYGREETLMAQPFDAGKLRITGAPFPVAEHVRPSHFVPSAFSVSQNGILVYRTSGSSNIQLAWHNRDGKRLASVGEPGAYRQVALSPDDKRLATERLDTAKNVLNVWILELSSGIFSRLTFSDDADPVWSPDGREVLFKSQRQSKSGLYRKVVGGDAAETLLLESDDSSPEDWLPDGKSILFINNDGIAFSQLPVSGERKPVVLVKSEFVKNEPTVSPDGHWIAYNSRESGRWEVYVATFPGFTEKRQVSNDGGGQALWRKAGKELFYLTLDGKLMAVSVKVGAAIETGIPRVLFQTRLTVNPRQDQYCVTGDGARFLFGEPVGEATNPVTVVLNWTAELKR